MVTITSEAQYNALRAHFEAETLDADNRPETKAILNGLLMFAGLFLGHHAGLSRCRTSDPTIVSLYESILQRYRAKLAEALPDREMDPRAKHRV